MLKTATLLTIGIVPLLLATAGCSKTSTPSTQYYTETTTTITIYPDHADTQVVVVEHRGDAEPRVIGTQENAGKESLPAVNSKASEANWRQYCLDVINMYRATENLKPLTLADESKQICADKQSAADLKSGVAHSHFGDCKEAGQNTGPDIPLDWIKTKVAAVDEYLKMMWDEKKLIESGERNPNNENDLPEIGHYLNMNSKEFKSVACGYAKSADGAKGWFNTNFYW